MRTPEQYPIFVYGTLRPGGWLYPVIEHAVKYTEPAELYNMQLYSLIDFPGMVLDTSANLPVQGDLLHFYKKYWAAAVLVLDRIEGNGTLFERTKGVVKTLNGSMNIWTYLYIEKPVEQLVKVESNDWFVEGE